MKMCVSCAVSQEVPELIIVAPVRKMMIMRHQRGGYVNLWKGGDGVLTGTALASTWLGQPLDVALFVVSLRHTSLLKFMHVDHTAIHQISTSSSPGGALSIAVDQVGLGEAAQVDNDLTTLDDLMERIAQDEVFQPLDGR